MDKGVGLDTPPGKLLWEVVAAQFNECLCGEESVCHYIHSVWDNPPRHPRCLVCHHLEQLEL